MGTPSGPGCASISGPALPDNHLLSFFPTPVPPPRQPASSSLPPLDFSRSQSPLHGRPRGWLTSFVFTSLENNDPAGHFVPRTLWYPPPDFWDPVLNVCQDLFQLSATPLIPESWSDWNSALDLSPLCHDWSLGHLISCHLFKSHVSIVSHLVTSISL